jgi:uncharacterized membrane protein
VEKQGPIPFNVSQRLFPLDALRGLIIILMALDHASFFVAQQHSSGEYWGGPFPAYTAALPFLTRFVTHVCAPGFFFLLGAGMILFKNARLKMGWDKGNFYKHFILRGGILIFLQFSVVNHLWELSAGGWPIELYIGVLFALGSAMIIGSFLIWLRPRTLLIITIALLLLSEVLTPDPARWGQFQSFNWIHVPELLLLTPGGTGGVWSNYPILPWIEFATFGMVFGYLLLEYGERSYSWALTMGAVFLTVFAIIRVSNGFGNIRPMLGDSWIDFLNVVKYPPSISFTFLTLGLILLQLGVLARINKGWHKFLSPLVVFGRSPLFFYVLHLFVYAVIGILFTPSGTSLGNMYFFWIAGLLLLYPLCLWYGRLKQRQRAGSILRLF